MEQRDVKEAFDQMRPSDEKMNDIWNKIEHGNVGRRKRIPFRKYLYRAAVFVLVTVSARFLYVFAIPCGSPGTSEPKEVLYVEQGGQSVVDVAKGILERGLAVYAPDIEFIDDTYVVFGNLRGIIVYNRETKKVAGTIDTQTTGCVYYDSQEKMTHVVKVENELVVFNSENGKAYGSFYKYLIEDINAEYPVIETGEDKAELDKYYEMWENSQKKYVSAFEEFSDVFDFDNLVNVKYGVYSEQSKTWVDVSGKTKMSFLTVEGEQYYLHTYDENKNVVSVEELVLSDGGSDGVSIPTFSYTGDDKVRQAIWDYFYKDVVSCAEEGEILIPAFVIAKEVKDDEEILVFGNFWTYEFELNGNLLEDSGGGATAACFHLIQTDTGYDVIYAEEAEDGGLFDESIKKMSKGYPGLYMKWMYCIMYGEKERDEALLESLRMYVEDNELDIQYYKMYGWDPVKIF